MAHFWFAFDVGAYEDSTAHLTMIQDGAYNRLLRHYYKTAKAIPDNVEQIQRISGAHSVEEIEAVTYILKSFFRLKSDGYHNKRADNELLRAKEVSKLRKEFGQKGGLAKARRLLLANEVAKGVAKPYTVTVTDTTTEPKIKSKAASAFCLPDWVPAKEWQDFEEMRRRVRKPMTDRARALIVAELFKLRTRYDPAAVLDQSIRNSWQDVFALRSENGTNRQVTQPNQPTRQPSAQVARWNNNRAERERARAAVVGQAGNYGDGQETRSSARDSPVLDGEIKKLQ